MPPPRCSIFTLIIDSSHLFISPPESPFLISTGKYINTLDGSYGSYDYFLSLLVHFVFFLMITLHNQPYTRKRLGGYPFGVLCF